MTPAVKIFLISALLSSIEAKHFLVETEELIRPDVSKKGNNSTDSRKKIDNDYTIDKIARPDLSKNGKKSTDSGKKGGNLCLCKAVADNVCGTDGETYANPCVARCNKVGVQCRGECPCQGAKSVMASGTCLCPRIYSPVCGTDGNEYANFCLAECEGVEGECEGECPCSEADYQDYPYPSQILNKDDIHIASHDYPTPILN